MWGFNMETKKSYNNFLKTNNENIERFGVNSNNIGVIQQVWWADESCQVRINGGVIDMSIADLVYDINNNQYGIVNPDAIQGWRCFT